MKRVGSMIAVMVLFLIAGAPVLAAAGPSAPAKDVWCSRGGGADLQAAIDAARTGATLRIHGVCVGNFAVPGGGSATALSLQGAPLARLDGGDAGTTLAIDGGATVSVSRLRITGGADVFEGGGIFVSSATLRLSHSTVAGNAACVGAGIAVLGGTATIVNSTIRGNDAGSGSFACDFTAGGGIEVDLASTVKLTGSVVSDNRVADGGAGGGMDIFGASVTVIRSTVLGNVADWNGGGVNDQYGSTLRLEHSSIDGNSTVRNGGGGIAIDGASATISASTLARNTAANAGGAILEFADLPDGSVTGNSALTLGDSQLLDNTASGEGGGAILAYGSNYGHGDFGADGTIATVVATNSIFSGDRAPAGYGGALWAVNDPNGTATTTLAGSELIGNRARFGGAVANVDPGPPGGLVRLSLEHRTAVVDNVASQDGGGVFNAGGAEVDIAPHVVLTGNEPNDCSGCGPNPGVRVPAIRPTTGTWRALRGAG